MTRVRDVMTTDLITVTPEASIRQMVRLMRAHRIDALLVVDPDDGRLAGIVTEADLMAKPAYGSEAPGDLALVWEESAGWGAEWVTRALGMRAGDLMTTTVLHTVPDASMAEAARAMLEAGVKHLPVVSGGLVVGMLSRSDVLRPFDRSDAQIRADVAACLTGLASAAAGSFDVADGIVTVRPGPLDPRELVELETRLAGLPGVAGVRVAAEQARNAD